MNILKRHNSNKLLKAKNELDVGKDVSHLDGVLQKPEFIQPDIELAEWSKKTHQFLKEAYTDEISIDAIKRNIKEGHFKLYHILENGEHISSLILTINQSKKFKELSVSALAGRTNGILLQIVNEFVHGLAKRLGANSIRIHVGNEKLNKDIVQLGYGVSETIYRKKV